MKELEEMKDHDLSVDLSLSVYIIYAIYEWGELSQKMMNLKIFRHEDHRKINPVSTRLFFEWRYGHIPKIFEKFTSDMISTIFSSIHGKLKKKNLAKAFGIPDSDITRGNFYAFHPEFYNMPISQIFKIVFPRTSYADPNLGCLENEQFNEKNRIYRDEKIMITDFESIPPWRRRTEPLPEEVISSSRNRTNKKSNKLHEIEVAPPVVPVLPELPKNGNSSANEMIPISSLGSEKYVEEFRSEQNKFRPKPLVTSTPTVLDNFEAVLHTLTKNKYRVKRFLLTTATAEFFLKDSKKERTDD